VARAVELMGKVVVRMVAGSLVVDWMVAAQQVAVTVVVGAEATGVAEAAMEVAADAVVVVVTAEEGEGLVAAWWEAVLMEAQQVEAMKSLEGRAAARSWKNQRSRSCGRWCSSRRWQSALGSSTHRQASP
jgi:hypothetical protein